MVCGTLVTCQRHGKFNLLITVFLLLLLLLFFDWMGYSIIIIIILIGIRTSFESEKKKSDYPAQILENKNSLYIRIIIIPYTLDLDSLILIPIVDIFVSVYLGPLAYKNNKPMTFMLGI